MKYISILTCVLGEPESLKNTFKSVLKILSSEVSWTLKFHTSTGPDFIKLFENALKFAPVAQW